LLSSPRAKELAKFNLPEMSLKEFRTTFGGDSVSDDDKLLNFFAGTDALATLKAAGAPRDCSSTKTPLLTLIEQISKRKPSSQVYLKRDGVTVRFSRRPATK